MKPKNTFNRGQSFHRPHRTQLRFCFARSWRRLMEVAFVMLLLGILTPDIRGAIPAAAKADPRYGLGYLVVTYYSGVNTNGTGDSTVGIQTAINDAFAANDDFFDDNIGRGLAVYFPPGTYLITNTLTCYTWQSTNAATVPKSAYVLIGSTEGGGRPTIKLTSSAPDFQDTTHPRPMIAFRRFKGSNGAVVPVDNPAGLPSGYTDMSPNQFNNQLRNIDFNCGGNVAAIGVAHNGAQECSVENVKVIATNAFAGFYWLPGAGAGNANLEVIGGQYGVMMGKFDSLHLLMSTASGATIVGLKLQDQTVAAYWGGDEVAPITICGFSFSNTKSVLTRNYDNTLGGSITLLDGQIGINGSVTAAIDNSAAKKNIYLRNVYVTGTTNLVKSDTTTTLGSGTWSKIIEYSYNNPFNVANVPPNTNYSGKSDQIESYSIINGTVQDRTVPFPITPAISNNCEVPPANLLSRHLWNTFPSYNGSSNDPATTLVSTNAGWGNTNYDNIALQSAIDSAWTNGNGRVFIPAGNYFITNTLTLHSNSVLIGVGRSLTRIKASYAWKPTTGEIPMMQTDDDANATTTLAWLSVAPRSAGYADDLGNGGESAANGINYNRFNALHWRAGHNSMVLGVETEEPYTWITNIPNSQVRSHIKITDHGGGKWYTSCLDGQGQGESNPGFRKVKVNGTTEPLWFYGFNIEKGLGDMDVEVSSASNVRMLGLKREGDRPMIVVSNSSNIAGYGLGGARNRPVTGSTNGYIQILGSSTNILMGNMNVQAIDDSAVGPNYNTLTELITGQPIAYVLWPNMVSLYKRGVIDDGAMFAAGGGGGPGGPLAYWNMEEGTGTTVNDQSGSYDGTIIGSAPLPSWVAGRIGSWALQFGGGSAGYVSATNIPTDWSGGMTLSGWVNLTSYTNNGRIVARNGDVSKAWGLGVESSGSWNFSVASSASARTNLIVAFNPAATTNNVWVHVLGTYDPAGIQPRIKLYTNGVLAGSANFTPTAMFDTTTNVCIGRRTSTEVIAGKLDDVRIYNRVLSNSEITNLAGGGLGFLVAPPLTRLLAPFFDGKEIKLNWNGAGELQWAPTIDGPWTSVVPSPTSSYSESVSSGENKFFRLKPEL